MAGFGFFQKYFVILESNTNARLSAFPAVIFQLCIKILIL